MLIFLDANILFSAANETSNIRRMLLLLTGQDALLTSPHVLDEAKRNVKKKRPAWEPSFKQLISPISIVPDCALQADVRLAAHDRPVLGAAIAAKCNYLLTGDKHDFGHLYGKIIDGVKIVDYLMMADIILQRYA